MFLIILICSQAKTQYIAECGKLGVEASATLIAEATKLAEVSRAVTLEGHYIRIIQTKKKEKIEWKDFGSTWHATRQ